MKETLTYVYGNGLLAQYADNETTTATKYLYYHFNNIGSTMAVTDANGEIKHCYAYSAYGELLSGSYGQVLFLYNGQYGVASDDNGLCYMRARYYNNSIKRFINQDVLTGEVKESQSLNRYAYVEGSPVTYLDPFGLEGKKASESRRHDLATIGVWLSGIAIAATIVIGGATIFFSEGTATPAVISIAESIGVGSAAGALTAGIASEYEWGYAYAKGYVSYEEATTEIGKAAFGNVLTISGGKIGTAIGKKVAQLTVNSNTKQIIVTIFEKVGGHLGDAWSISTY